MQKVFSIGYATWCDSLAQLTYDTGTRHLWTDVRTSRDSVVILAPSTDIIDELQIVQLTHGNLITCWNQLRLPRGPLEPQCSIEYYRVVKYSVVCSVVIIIA